MGVGASQLSNRLCDSVTPPRPVVLPPGRPAQAQARSEGRLMMNPKVLEPPFFPTGADKGCDPAAVRWLSEAIGGPEPWPAERSGAQTVICLTAPESCLSCLTLLMTLRQTIRPRNPDLSDS